MQFIDEAKYSSKPVVLRPVGSKRNISYPATYISGSVMRKDSLDFAKENT